MQKDKNTSFHPDAGSMLNQKTNEDFNKKKPDPKDPNEQKTNPNAVTPNIEPDENEIVGGNPIHQNKGKNKADGSE